MAITATTIFDFMGIPSELRTTEKTNMITNLITPTTLDLESIINRRLSETEFEIVAQDGVNCEIIGNEIYLSGVYTDAYEISEIELRGTALEQSTAYGDDGDYILFLDGQGLIIGLGPDWPLTPNTIKISGSTGYVDEDGEMMADAKQCLIEIIATKTGLWTRVINDQEVLIQEYQEETLNAIKKLKNLTL